MLSAWKYSAGSPASILLQGPTKSTVWETAGELEIAGDGEDVEEVEEDVDGHDGCCAESRLGLDAPQLALWPHWLLAHLEGQSPV